MANGYQGFAALGDVIFGGPQQRAEAEYPKHLQQAANAQRAVHDKDRALEEARLATSRRIARDGLRGAIESDPVLSKRAALAYSVLGQATTQPNLGTYTAGLGDIADMELNSQIQEKLQLGDLAGASILSAVKTDKVLPSLEAGGKAVFTPVTGDVDLTSLGDAALASEAALTNQRGVSAQATLTRAEASAKLADARRAELLGAEGAGSAPALGDAVLTPVTLGDAAAREGFQSFDDLPAEVRGRLKEGVETRFSNGQWWALVNGQPTRVR